jgi:hypothetical protein
LGAFALLVGRRAAVNQSSSTRLPPALVPRPGTKL